MEGLTSEPEPVRKPGAEEESRTKRGAEETKNEERGRRRRREKGCVNLKSIPGKYQLVFHVVGRLRVEYKPKETLTDLFRH